MSPGERSNAQENFDKNMKKFKERKRSSSKKRGKKPRFEKMNATQQRFFVTALTSNKETRDMFNSVVAEVVAAGEQTAPPPHLLPRMFSTLLIISSLPRRLPLHLEVVTGGMALLSCR